MRPAPFRPSEHGFPFENSFLYPGSIFGLATPMLPGFGLCAGMAWGALDRWVEGRRVPRELGRPEAGEPLYLELVQRQANAFARGAVAQLTRWQRLPDRARRGRPGLGDLTRREWRGVRRSLDAGLPVMLVLVRASDPFASLAENHVVLAYRYEVSAFARRVTLWVYDPNRPGNDGVRLTFRLGSAATPLEGRLAVQSKVRGFFAVGYDRRLPPAIHCEVAGAGGAAAIEPPALVGRPASALDAGGRLHVYGHEAQGRLLHIRRGRGGRWALEVVADKRRPTDEIPPGAVMVPLPGAGRLIGRSAAGELLEYRRRPLRGWRVASVIDGKDDGGRPRFDSEPVVLAAPRRPLSVFARSGADLLLVRWGRRRAVENLSARLGISGKHPLCGELAAVMGPDGAAHVLARSAHGSLVHVRGTADGTWTAREVSAEVIEPERFRLAGDPVAIVGPGGKAIHAFGRNLLGEVLHFRWAPKPGWRVRNLTVEHEATQADPRLAASPPVVIPGPGGTLHLFARAYAGRLLHWWTSPSAEWRSEDLTASRLTADAELRIEGTPQAVMGPGGSLCVFARSADALLLWRWSPEADWVLESITAERGAATTPTADPVVVAGQHGAVHVLAPTAEGVHHIGVGLRPVRPGWTLTVRTARTVGEGVSRVRPPSTRLVALRLRVLYNRVRRLFPGASRPEEREAVPPVVSVEMRSPSREKPLSDREKRRRELQAFGDMLG